MLKNSACVQYGIYFTINICVFVEYMHKLEVDAVSSIQMQHEQTQFFYGNTQLWVSLCVLCYVR